MKVLTANRLRDGEAVWYSHGRWAEVIDNADLASDLEAEARLQAVGAASLANNEVVDVELIDVALVDGTIEPLRLREKIRAAGPSNRNDLGKQARPEAARAA